MLLINLYGAPGSGKSTGAAYVFSKLKLAGFNIELITEAAKDIVWNGNWHSLENSIYVSGLQSQRITRLLDKVDIAITDSPILLGIIYRKLNNPSYLTDAYDKMVSEFDKRICPSWNYLIKRVKPYNPVGRVQRTEEESRVLEDRIKNLLDEYHPDNYVTITGDTVGYDKIVNEVLFQRYLASNEENV